MSYSVEFQPEAISDLEAVTSTVRTRILKKIRWLANNFDELTPQALSGNLAGSFKLRVGDYRAIYAFDMESRSLIIQRVGHRRDVYT